MSKLIAVRWKYETLGLEGALRVSPLHCHGTDDIDKFLKITKDIAEGK